MITAFVGYDPREAAAYHVFCQSVIEHASVPVRFVPLHRPMLQNFDGQRDGSNAFIFSRFLIPELMNFSNEWVAFFDGDMVMREDIAQLWAQRSVNKALMVVPHAYETAHPRKYIGTPLESINVDYPRKNQSSVMLWNCGHYAHRILTRQFHDRLGTASKLLQVPVAREQIDRRLPALRAHVGLGVLIKPRVPRSCLGSGGCRYSSTGIGATVIARQGGSSFTHCNPRSVEQHLLRSDSDMSESSKKLPFDLPANTSYARY